MASPYDLLIRNIEASLVSVTDEIHSLDGVDFMEPAANEAVSFHVAEAIRHVNNISMALDDIEADYGADDAIHFASPRQEYYETWGANLDDDDDTIPF